MSDTVGQYSFLHFTINYWDYLKEYSVGFLVVFVITAALQHWRCFFFDLLVIAGLYCLWLVFMVGDECGDYMFVAAAFQECLEQ